MAQADFQNVFGLDFAQVKRLHQLGFWLVCLTNHPNHFIDVQKGNHATVENVDAFFHLLQTMLQTAGNGGYAEIQPFLQNGFQIFLRRPFIVADHHQIYRRIAFQAGLRHQGIDEILRIHATGTRLEHQAYRLLAVAFVAYFFNQFQHQLAGIELILAELFLTGFRLGIGLLFDFGQNFLGAGIGRQFGNDHAPLAARQFFHFITRTYPHAAAAALVNIQQFLAAGNDLAAAGKIRALDVFHQSGGIERRLFQQRNRRLGNFSKVVRRNFGGHADSNAGCPVEQHHR